MANAEYILLNWKDVNELEAKLKEKETHKDSDSKHDAYIAGKLEMIKWIKERNIYKKYNKI